MAEQFVEKTAKIFEQFTELEELKREIRTLDGKEYDVISRLDVRTRLNKFKVGLQDMIAEMDALLSVHVPTGGEVDRATMLAMHDELRCIRRFMAIDGSTVQGL